MDFERFNREILPPDEGAMRRAKARWDSIAKPLNSLGELEKICIRIAGLTGSERLSLKKRAVVVFCADNGVVAQGVTQTDASVTASMAEMIARGRSSVCRMAEAAGAAVFPVDIGMLRRAPGVRDLHIRNGTGDISRGPAMTPQEAERAVETGIRLVRECREQGYALLATGEMGIGNTTTAGAMASVLLGIPAERAVGRGAGLSEEGLLRKREAVRRAVACNRPDAGNAFGVLWKLGGLDIAGMAGMFLGGALYRVPVLIDGFISAVAALTAARLCPGSVCAMIASHCSAEPAAQAVLDALSLQAVIHAGLRLGEGTGAVCMMPLLDLAVSVYDGAAAFADAGVAAYTPQGEETL